MLASFVDVSSHCYLLAIFDPPYSLIPSPSIRHWIRAFDSTHIMRNAHLLEELALYWPSKFVLPFWNLLPMGEKFKGFKGIGFILKIGLFLSVCLSCISYLLCFAWLNI